MTRDQIVARIKELQERLELLRLDPLQSHSEGLVLSKPVLRELTELHERLRVMDAAHPR